MLALADGSNRAGFASDTIVLVDNGRLHCLVHGNTPLTDPGAGRIQYTTLPFVLHSRTAAGRRHLNDWREKSPLAGDSSTMAEWLRVIVRDRGRSAAQEAERVESMLSFCSDTQ